MHLNHKCKKRDDRQPVYQLFFEMEKINIKLSKTDHADLEVIEFEVKKLQEKIYWYEQMKSVLWTVQDVNMYIETKKDDQHSPFK